MRVLVDVREPSEYARGHVEGAINLPPSEVMNGAKVLQDIPKDAEIILYCLSGARSNMTIMHLKQLGYTNLVNGINQDHVSKNYL